MSRYKVECFDQSLACIVGWDAPLATFFAQVEHLGRQPLG
jgi:hypothetical protein